MRHFITTDELNRALDENKTESSIRALWVNMKQGEAYKDYMDKKKEEYASLYPDTDENGTPITYLEYSNEEPDPMTGDLKPVFPDDCYKFDEETGERILTEECQELVNAGRVRPTLSYYLTKADQEWIEPQADMSEYVEFIKPYLLKLTNDQFQKASNLITAQYPEAEQQSWPKQEAEARAYLADPDNAVTPMLDGIATNRGIDKATLAQKVVEKADALAKAVGDAIGLRQRAEDEINAISTVDELDALIAKYNQLRDIFMETLTGQ